jgi:hypothetical protein
MACDQSQMQVAEEGGMRFRAKVIPSGNATGVEVPSDVMKALGSEARPLVAVTINGHVWRSRVALMRGQCLIGISSANRQAARISEGDIVEVDVGLDNEPRNVPEPPDLTMALDSNPKARAAFDRLPFGLKQKHVAAIDDAKTAEVRERRTAKLIATLSG